MPAVANITFVPHAAPGGRPARSPAHGAFRAAGASWNQAGE